MNRGSYDINNAEVKLEITGPAPALVTEVMNTGFLANTNGEIQLSFPEFTSGDEHSKYTITVTARITDPPRHNPDDNPTNNIENGDFYSWADKNYIPYLFTTVSPTIHGNVDRDGREWSGAVSVESPCKKICLTFDDLDETISDAEIDNAGVRNSFQAKANNARKQYDRGNLKASGNVLCALLHEVDGQDGKHIDPVSAQDLRDCVISLGENLGIPLPCQSEKSVVHDLYPNFPNPVHSSTYISYTLPAVSNQRIASSEPRRVNLSIYDITGRLVKRLVDREQESGSYTVEWNGEDGRGRKVSNGIYFYRLLAGDHIATRKLILIK